MDLQHQLDEAKRRFLDAEVEMKELQRRIAVEKCPLKAGDVVKINDGKREYDGIVEEIRYHVPALEIMTPKIGSETGWAASGHQLKKDGSLSSWSFSIISFDFDLVAGKWHRKDTSINGILGIAATGDSST